MTATDVGDPSAAAGSATVLRLHPLTFLAEGDEVTVGRRDTGEYCVLPADGAALLQHLADGDSLAAAAAWYAETYGEPVDVAEFVEALAELGFLAGDEPQEPLAPLRWTRTGQILFSTPMWLVYAAVVFAGVVATATQPGVAPSYRHLFFTHYMSVIEATLFLGQFPLILLHESFHLFAGRRLGLPSRLSVSRRLYFIVFETSLDGLVGVPRRRRYLPILAGLLADLLVYCLLVLAADALLAAGVPLAAHVLLALSFMTMLRMVWHAYFYLQTDLYQLLVTALRCADLHRTAQRVLVNRLRRLVGRADAVDETTLRAGDLRAARWYAWLMVIGYAFSIATLVLAIVPSAWRAIGVVVGRLAGSGAQGVSGTVDSVVFLGLNVLQLVVVGVLMVRARRRRVATPAAVHVLD